MSESFKPGEFVTDGVTVLMVYEGERMRWAYPERMYGGDSPAFTCMGCRGATVPAADALCEACFLKARAEQRAAREPGPTHFAFLIKRPRDKEAWPTIFASREGAEGYEHRASPVVPVHLISQTQPKRDHDTPSACAPPPGAAAALSGEVPGLTQPPGDGQR